MQIAPFDQCCADCNHRLDVQKGYDILLEALMNMLEARWTGGSWDEAYEPHDHRKVARGMHTLLDQQPSQNVCITGI